MVTTSAATSPASTTSRHAQYSKPVGASIRARFSMLASLGWTSMRITVFRRLMAEEFGSMRAEMLAKDHVLTALGGRTIDQALAAGMSTKDIWRAVCDDFDVPPERR